MGEVFQSATAGVVSARGASVGRLGDFPSLDECGSTSSRTQRRGGESTEAREGEAVREKAKLVAQTVTRIVCPHCEQPAGQIDHLIGRPIQTRWHCDACGGGYALEIAAAGDVFVEPMPDRTITTIDVLVLKPQDKPVYFVVKGRRFTGGPTTQDKLRASAARLSGQMQNATFTEAPGDEDDRKRFYYESHSCPTNWLKPEMVYYDGDDDPHGLLEFVAWCDESTLPDDQDYGPNDRDGALVAFVEQQIQRGERR